MPATNENRREQLREAFEKASEVEDTEAVEEPTTEEEPAEEAAPEPEPEAAEGEEAQADEAPAGGRDRDDKGRFAKGAKAKEEPAPKASALQAKPAAAKVEPAKAVEEAKPKHPGDDLKAPQSWNAAAREDWKNVPPVARQEIHRLEGETRRVLQENAQIRKQAGEANGFRQAVSEMVSPYAGAFQAEGMNPMQGLYSLVQSYGVLTYGSPDQKAELLANLVNRYGDLDRINSRLQGQPAPQQGPSAPPPRQPQDIEAMVERAAQKQIEAAQKAAMDRQADSELEAFMGTNPEFARDVWQDMQLILDAAHQGGRKMTYQAAYDRACKMNEDVQAVLARRAEVAKVTAQPSAAPAQRARVAAATVQSRPTGGVGGPSDGKTDRRAMLKQQMERSRG